MRFSALQIESYLALFWLLSVSPSSFGYSVQLKSLPQMFHDAAKVSRFKIIGSKTAVVDKNGKRYDCGIDYEVKVISSFKGGNAPFTFRSASKLATGREYVAFFNKKYLDAAVEYMSMGRSDKAGYEVCTEMHVLYVSDLHGEILEYDYLWKAVTGNDSFRVTLDVPYVDKFGVKTVEFRSNSVSNDYSDLMGFWRISWKRLQEALTALSTNAKEHASTTKE